MILLIEQTLALTPYPLPLAPLCFEDICFMNACIRASLLRARNCLLNAGPQVATATIEMAARKWPARNSGLVLMAGLCLLHSFLMPRAIASESVSDSTIAVSWELITNFTETPDGFEARWVLSNQGTQALEDQGWGLYFNMAPRPIVAHPQAQSGKVEHLNGDWYRLVPEAGFRLLPGQSTEIRYMGIEAVIKEADAPLGLYFAYQNKPTDAPRIERVTQYTIMPFTEPHQILRGPKDQLPVPTPQWRYQENQALHLLPADGIPLIVPTPVQTTQGSGHAIVGSDWSIAYSEELKGLAEYLAEEFNSRFTIQLAIRPIANQERVSDRSLQLKLSPIEVQGTTSEAYQLKVAEEHIEVTGSDTAGVFYGLQSLMNLAPLPVDAKPRKQIAFPVVTIQDAPRFGYRGLHVDVSRNFQSKETLERILDVMAMYKLNRLLLYTTEDEGWRIEIPGLPELTSVGGQRQHNSGMVHASLHPAYGSGPVAYAQGSHGSGYYTRSEFIDLLRYAAQRQIKIIPEVNFPGHARAAIKAMEARYERLMSEGKPEAAEEYRLIDPLDTSVYRSAQAYKDNVVSVARPSTYRFYHKVLDELAAMYAEAGLKMDEIHTGGDEVPSGSWTQSPMAKKLLETEENIGGVQNLQSYFFRRLLSDLENRGLKALGWEEVFQRKNSQGAAEPNPEFVGRDVVAYIWNNLFDYDLGNRLANIGYPVILCNVSNFYFDLAYDNDPKEPGLYWAGFVGEKDAFLFAPYNTMATTFRTSMGQPIDIEAVQAKYQPLKPEAHANILGVQAQLWSETIKGREMIEYYMLPKIIGFAESAWAAERDWETIPNRTNREQRMQEAWNVMANCIGQREMPRLAYLRGGYNYRVPPPGGIIENGMLRANTSLPGLTIRYSLDGKDPQADSAVYSQPVAAQGEARLRAFDSAGRFSRVMIVTSP